MSLRARRIVHHPNGFPRVSGDEPARRAAVEASVEFSPREWG